MRTFIAFVLICLLSTSLWADDHCPVCGRIKASSIGRPSSHPPFQNRFRYPREINPTLQRRALREAKMLAQYSFQENQRRWTSSNGALGHPVGVPPGYIGGTGCSWPRGEGTIATCEPQRPLVLVAEAIVQSPIDGTFYSSRIWRDR